jgi:exosortase
VVYIKPILYLLPLGWLWFRLIDHLRVGWSVYPQYAYGWAVPCLCLYLLWRNAETRKCGNADMLESRYAPIPTPFSFSAFQLFSFFLLCFLYLPTRLIQEANPEWRLVSWALALEVVAITLLLLRTIHYGSRITHHGSRFTFPVCFFLVAVPWPTVIEGPVIQGLMRANTGVTVELLGVIGVPAIQHGNVIEVATGSVGIDDACSGIRSLQATLMLALFFGELYALSARRRALCIFAGFVLAVVFNVGRTLLLTWVASAKGVGAVASWHDPAGVTILVACFLSLWLIARAFQKAESRKQKAESSGGKAEILKSETLKSSAQKAEGEEEKAESRNRNPVSAAFSMSAFQRFSIFLTAWLLVVETGTEIWYRVQESHLPKAVAWRVEFPRDNPTYRELPLAEAAKRLLRPDEGISASWTEAGHLQWQVIYLRWNAGRIAGYLAKSHTPQICMPGAGFNLRASSPTRFFSLHGIELPFRSYVFERDGDSTHLYYCRWEDRPSKEMNVGGDAIRVALVRSVWTGRGNGGQRVLEVAIRGITDQDEADAAFTRELEKLIRIEKPTDYGTTRPPEHETKDHRTTDVTQGQGPAGACPHVAQTLMTLGNRYEPPPDDHSGAETGQGKERNEDDDPNSELGLRISFGVRLSVFGVLCGFAVPPSPFHL